MEKDANDSADSFLDELANENKDYKTPRFNDPLFNRGAKFLLFLFLRRILSFTIDKILILILFFVVMSIWFGPYNWAYLLGYASGSITMNFNEVLFAKDHGSYILYLSFLNSVSFLTVFIVVGRIYYFLCEITFKKEFRENYF